MKDKLIELFMAVMFLAAVTAAFSMIVLAYGVVPR